MKEEVKALWKQCFDDTDEFVELYFRRCYTEQRNMALQRDGKVIAAMQLLPHSMTFCGTEIETAYVSGACTHPDHRGRGIMRELLAQAFVRMRTDGAVLSTLIPAEPWLSGYYARNGYAAVFPNHTRRCILSEQGEALVREAAKSPIAGDCYAYLHSRLRERPCCIQHSKEEFHTILTDLRQNGGAVCTLRDNGTITALAMLYPHGTEWLIGELLADYPDAEARLLQRLGSVKQADASPPGMARIIHAENFLRHYAAAHPQLAACYQLIDAQLPANNGCYQLKNGVCTLSDTPSCNDFRTISIGELAEELLPPLHPHMSLMLNL